MQLQILNVGEPGNIDPYFRDICVTPDFTAIGAWGGYGNGTVLVIPSNGQQYKMFRGPQGLGLGVASDGKSLWAGGYFDQTIYQFDLATMTLTSSWVFTQGYPVHMDYDPATKSLFITAYGSSVIYQYSTSGVFMNAISIASPETSLGIAVTPKGFLIYGNNNPFDNVNDQVLYYYSKSGQLIWKKTVDWGFFSIDYLDGMLYNDTLTGEIQRRPISL